MKKFYKDCGRGRMQLYAKPCKEGAIKKKRRLRRFALEKLHPTRLKLAKTKNALVLRTKKNVSRETGKA